MFLYSVCTRHAHGLVQCFPRNQRQSIYDDGHVMLATPAFAHARKQTHIECQFWVLRQFVLAGSLVQNLDTQQASRSLWYCRFCRNSCRDHLGHPGGGGPPNSTTVHSRKSSRGSVALFPAHRLGGDVLQNLYWSKEINSCTVPVDLGPKGSKTRLNN